MDAKSFEQVQEPSSENVQMVHVFTLGRQERTLVYGYTLERETFHVYVRGGEIHVHIYNYKGETLGHIHGDELPAEMLRPSKRAYPERTEYAFAQYMKSIGHPLTFTNFNQEKYDENIFATYYGKIV
jgi:hypothetical protein